MKTLSEFYPRILPNCAGCPEPLMAQALVDTAIEFCDTASAVRYSLAPVAVAANTATYTLTTPAGEQVSRLMQVTFDGTVLVPVARDDVVGSQLPTATSTPTSYFTVEDESVFSITLYPTPDTAGSLVVDISARPTRAATQIRDVLFNDHVDAIVAGTLARVLMTPNQVYSNPQLSANYRDMFGKLTRKARVESASGRVNTSRSVRMRAFA